MFTNKAWIIRPVPVVLTGQDEVLPVPVVVEEVVPRSEAHVAVLTNVGDIVAEAVDVVLHKVHHHNMSHRQVRLEGVGTAIS